MGSYRFTVCWLYSKTVKLCDQWWPHSNSGNMMVIFIFVTGSEQMGEGINIIFTDIKIGRVSEFILIFILNMR